VFQGLRDGITISAQVKQKKACITASL